MNYDLLYGRKQPLDPSLMLATSPPSMTNICLIYSRFHAKIEKYNALIFHNIHSFSGVYKLLLTNFVILNVKSCHAVRAISP